MIQSGAPGQELFVNKRGRNRVTQVGRAVPLAGHPRSLGINPAPRSFY